MASALLSLPFNLPPSSSPLSAVPNSPKPKSHIRLFTSSRRRARVTASAADQEKTKDTEKDSDSDSAAFNPFGFVTDNPSSRSAIQISESPAESGNVGQMLYFISLHWSFRYSFCAFLVDFDEFTLLYCQFIKKFSDLAFAYEEMCYSAYCHLVFGVEQLPSQATDASVWMMIYKTWISISSFNHMKNWLELVKMDAINLLHFIKELHKRIEDKGKEYGKYFRAGEYVWFVRETGSAESERGTVVFLHGAPTQSYSYRNVMSQLSEDFGFRCLAPDWLGFGFSDKPQAGYDDFDYKEEEFHKEFDKLLDKLRVKSPFYLVVQGFLVGSYGLTWALKNPSKISKLAILNTPLTVSSPVPGLFKQLRFPFLGEFTCQNAVMAERFIEAGSAYVLKLEKADVYRLPYLSSSGPGFALLETTRKANFNGILSQISSGFASGRWNTPTLVVWGISDKYLPQSIAEEFQKANPTAVQLKLIEGAGHMPQEDCEVMISPLECLIRFQFPNAGEEVVNDNNGYVFYENLLKSLPV
ncbi:hypothetical protein C1H46_040504 [Malus baccata]|uniref:AB hydrolase-1 domain-containing protein n=1 Tax=Malus baccata TaxID=106549 RepID=A0A540KIA7_MALBA|nr:hypothetical protein C1H46_040504 [Malus baccata]